MTTNFKNQIIAEQRSLKNLKVGWWVLHTAQQRGTWVSQTFSLASYMLQHWTLQKSKFNTHCKVDCSCTHLQTCHLMWHQTSWKVTEVSDLQKVMEAQGQVATNEWPLIPLLPLGFIIPPLSLGFLKGQNMECLRYRQRLLVHSPSAP